MRQYSMRLQRISSIYVKSVEAVSVLTVTYTTWQATFLSHYLHLS